MNFKINSSKYTSPTSAPLGSSPSCPPPPNKLVEGGQEPGGRGGGKLNNTRWRELILFGRNKTNKQNLKKVGKDKLVIISKFIRKLKISGLKKSQVSYLPFLNPICMNEGYRVNAIASVVKEYLVRYSFILFFLRLRAQIKRISNN